MGKVREAGGLISRGNRRAERHHAYTTSATEWDR